MERHEAPDDEFFAEFNYLSIGHHLIDRTCSGISTGTLDGSRFVNSY